VEKDLNHFNQLYSPKGENWLKTSLKPATESSVAQDSTNSETGIMSGGRGPQGYTRSLRS